MIMATRDVLVPGDRVMIVGDGPEHGLTGVVTLRALFNPLVFRVQLDRKHCETLYFRAELAREHVRDRKARPEAQASS